jgi:hypothetical protein
LLWAVQLLRALLFLFYRFVLLLTLLSLLVLLFLGLLLFLFGTCLAACAAAVDDLVVSWLAVVVPALQNCLVLRAVAVLAAPWLALAVFQA